MPKVTVAIPTYNRKEYLKETIDSILVQTFQDFSIVVFDNHSDYDVQEFLNEFDDPRISTIISPVNLGTYNRIFEHPFDSEYVIIFHDDDVMHPELLEREVAALDARPELVWVGTDLQFIKDYSRMYNFVDVKNRPVAVHDSAGIVRIILGGFNLCYGSVMYRADRLECMDPFTVRYGKWADRPHLITLAKKGKAGILDEQLVNYRLHPGQDSQAPAPESVRYLINVLTCYKEGLNGLNNAADRRLFYSHVANTAIPAALASVHTVSEFKRSLEPYRRNGLLRFRYLGARGLFRIARTIARKIKSNA